MPGAPEPSDLLAASGWFGAVALLAGYVQISRGRLTGGGVAYQGLSVAGSLGLGAAAMGGGVWSSVVLNALWVAVGVVTLARRSGSTKRPGRAVRGVPDLDPGLGEPVADQIGGREVLGRAGPCP